MKPRKMINYSSNSEVLPREVMSWSPTKRAIWNGLTLVRQRAAVNAWCLPMTVAPQNRLAVCPSIREAISGNSFTPAVFPLTNTPCQQQFTRLRDKQQYIDRDFDILRVSRLCGTLTQGQF